jgi:hypothetical protein
LADYLNQLGRQAAARPYARTLLGLTRGDPAGRSLAERLGIR